MDGHRICTEFEEGLAKVGHVLHLDVSQTVLVLLLPLQVVLLLDIDLREVVVLALLLEDQAPTRLPPDELLL